MKPDGTDEIADALGWDRATAPQVLGIGWYPLDPNAVAEDEASVDNMRWWMAGEPAQVMLGISGRTSLTVARPKVVWDSQVPLLIAEEPTTEPLNRLDIREWVMARTHEVARQRCSTFRYCRLCRKPVGPEHCNTAPDVCDGCAERFRGYCF